MLASELITKLQALIEQHGDLPLATMDYSTGAIFWMQDEPERIKPARINGLPQCQEAILIPGTE